jgi:serine phosphatase RsbU (regulator of sigma subunit)
VLAAIFFVLALILTARAWRSGRSGDPARVPGHLTRLGIATAIETILFPFASRATGAASIASSAVLAVAAAVAFDGMVSLALWGRSRPIALWIRAPFALAAIIIAATGGTSGAIAFTAAAALMSYRWRGALDTGGLFRSWLGALSLVILFLLPLPEPAKAHPGAQEAIAHFVAAVAGAARLYVLVGLFKTFAAFTRDPSLGIRTVTRRLALSHVLVLAVPLVITVALWVSTTYLGVNADRALSGRRLLQREGVEIASGLATAGASDHAEAALVRFASDRKRTWPGTRLWVTHRHGLVRVLGDTIVGEERLAAWVAGADTLPDHGVIGLRGHRWLGAIARVGADSQAVVMLTPVRDALDSTLTPVLRARFTMQDKEAPEDTVEHKSRRAVADSIAALVGDTTLARKIRERARHRSHYTFTTQRSQSGVAVGTERDTSASISFSGMSMLSGPEWMGRRWEKSNYMLVARADLRSTLVGLFSNVAENPLQAVPITMLTLLVLLLLPVAMTDLSMVRGMGRSIADAVGALRTGAAALGQGDLGHRIEIRGNDDLWETARQFNRMAEGLERARALEKERDRLESELELARRIQQRLLPAGPPSIEGLDIAGCSEPAREVGGDYYDHIDLGGGRVLLVIADVSGKGVPAALLMSGFRASLMSQDAQALGPERLAERVNDFLHRSVETGKFVTAFLGFLDSGTGHIVYANAGHNPPVLLRRDGRVEWLAAGGVVLGIMPHFRFESGEAVLEPGDLLALYTDGVTEGQNAAGELWGDDRLIESLRRLAGRPSAEAARALVSEVRAYEGEAGAADDVTVLMARRV